MRSDKPGRSIWPVSSVLCTVTDTRLCGHVTFRGQAVSWLSGPQAGQTAQVAFSALTAWHKGGSCQLWKITITSLMTSYYSKWLYLSCNQLAKMVISTFMFKWLQLPCKLLLSKWWGIKLSHCGRSWAPRKSRQNLKPVKVAIIAE